MFRVRYYNLDRELTLAPLNALQRDLGVLWVASQGRLVLFVEAGNEALLQRALERLPLARLSRAEFDPQDRLGAPLRVVFEDLTPEQPLRLALALGRGAVRLRWREGMLRCEVLGEPGRIEQALAECWPRARVLTGWRRAQALFDKGVKLPPGRVALPSAGDHPTLASRNRALPAFDTAPADGLLLGKQESDGRPVHLPVPLRAVWSGFTPLVPPTIWRIVERWIETPGRDVIVLDGVGWSARRSNAGLLVSWTNPGQGQRLNPLEPPGVAVADGAARQLGSRATAKASDALPNGAAIAFDKAAIAFDGAAVAFDGAAIAFDGAAYTNLVLEWLAALGINETLTGTPTYRLLRVILKLWGRHSLDVAGEPLTPSIIASILEKPELTEQLPIPPLSDPEDWSIWQSRNWPAARANLMPAADRLRRLLALPQLNVLWCPPFSPIAARPSPLAPRPSPLVTILAPGNTRATRAFLASCWLPLRHRLTPETLVVGLGVGELGKQVLGDAEGRGASVLLWGKQVTEACGVIPVQACDELSRVGGIVSIQEMDILVSRTPDAPDLARLVGVSCEHILAQADDQLIARIGGQVAALVLPGDHTVLRPSSFVPPAPLIILGPVERAFALFQSLIARQRQAGAGGRLLLLSGNGRSPAPPDVPLQSLSALDLRSGNPLALVSDGPETTHEIIAAGLRAGRQAFLWRPGVTPPAEALFRLRAVVYGEWESEQVGRWGNEGVSILILGEGSGMPEALSKMAKELVEGEGLLIERGKGARRVRID